MPEEIEVPTEHLHEKMEEHAHHAHAGHGGGDDTKTDSKWISRVAVSSALLAVAAAISALLAGHHANEAMFEEMKSTDTWGEFQAKGIKKSLQEIKLELIQSNGKPIDPKDKEKLTEYDGEKTKLQAEAHELDESAEAHMRHHTAFAHAVTAFQIAIAMGAIAVLARRPKLWYISLGLGAVGSVFLVLGLL